MISRKLVTLAFTVVLFSAGVLAMLSLPGSPPAAHAKMAARYVAVSGNDTANDCAYAGNPCRTVQHAIDEASDGDSILVATGVYTDVHGRPIPPGYPAPVGSTVEQVVMVTRTVTIRGGYTTDYGPPDPEANPTTLDAGGQGRVLTIAGAISPSIEGLRITGGDATGQYGEGGPVDVGGGVYSSDATAVLSGNLVFGNKAPGYGGGLYLRLGTVTLTNNTVLSNTASYGGGVRLFYSDGVLTGNTFGHNTANSGGGVVLTYCDAMTFSDNTVISNTATGGSSGGIDLYVCPAVISGNMVISNTATDNAGGLYVDAADNATVQGNTFTANAAEDGGGLFLFQTTAAALVDNRFTANTAEAGGGIVSYLSDGTTMSGNTLLANTTTSGGVSGIFVRDSDATLINNVIAGGVTSTYYNNGLYICDDSKVHLIHTTIANNGGQQSYGLSITSFAGDPSTVAMTNTILTGHMVGIYVEALSSATLEGTLWQNNIDWNGYGVIITGTHNFWGDPRFGADGYHLVAGSAAIDRGIDAGVMADIDGEPRPQGGAPDLGADECSTCTAVRFYLPVVLRGH